MTYSLKDLATRLKTGSQSARALVDECLAAIDDPNGEGKRSFIDVYHDRARKEADAVDHARKQGWSLPAFAGIPLSIKDLFDEAGIVTRAGSKILQDAAPASTDATVLARLKAAGARVDPPVSDPIVAGAMPSLIETALPDEDPPATRPLVMSFRSRSNGQRASP